MGRLTIAPAVVDKFEAVGAAIQREWVIRAGPDSLARVVQELATRYEVRQSLDLDASARLSRRSVPGCCYWNARRALVSDPDFRHARYVEGIAVWSAEFAGDASVQTLSLEAQGWLELPDGRIVDPTITLTGPTSPRLREDARRGWFHVPVLRFEREAVAGAELPRLMHSAANLNATLLTLTGVMEALAAELVAQPTPAPIPRALRLGRAAGRSLRLAAAGVLARAFMTWRR